MHIPNNFVILKTVDGLVGDKLQPCKTCKTTDKKVMHRSINEYRTFISSVYVTIA